MKTNILDEILEHKRREVEGCMKSVPVELLQERIAARSPIRDFAKALRLHDRVSIIAEVKKASPSKGILIEEFDPVSLAKAYASCGASAISVVTESRYFLGDISYLADIRNCVSVPILRKDFIFSAYQVLESAAYGADALLLIASVLDDTELSELLTLAESIGLSCLVETHNAQEIRRAASAGASIIGINNRDLSTFSVDINTTTRLRHEVPVNCLLVSESGIRSRNDMQTLKECDVHAALIGETLVTSGDISTTMKELMI